MKKILFLAPSNSIHAKKWIESQISSNHELHWYSLYKKSQEIDSKIIYNEFKSDNFFQLLFSTIKIFILINKIKPDIIHVHYLGKNILPIFFLSNKENIFVSPWGSDLKLVNPFSFKGIILKKIFEKCRIITVDAAFMYEEVSKFSKNVNNKIVRINFGTNIDKFVKIQSNITNDKFKLISLRNLEDIYSIETLIFAIEILVKSNVINIIVDIYGRGSLESKLKQLVKTKNLENYIFFKGKYNYDDLPIILNDYNLYISTSLSDAGLSASTSEAMSCELPVLLSDNSENPYWVANDCGFLFETKSYFDLSEKIKYIMNLPHGNLLQVANNGRNKIIQENNFIVEMDKIKKLYL